MPPPIRRLDLHADIRARLHGFIAERRLVPGDRLPSEHELVRALDVSRSALREALRSLEALGVIEARHGTGRFLNGFSLDTVGASLGYLLVLDIARSGELLEIRRALEVAFLPGAAAHLLPEDLNALRGIVATMRAKRDLGQETVAEESRFHATLFGRVDNDLLKELLALFWDLMGRVHASGLLPPSRAREMPDMHGQIVELIAAGSIEPAVAVLHAHFEDLAERLRELRASARAVSR